MMSEYFNLKVFHNDNRTLNLVALLGIEIFALQVGGVSRIGTIKYCEFCGTSTQSHFSGKAQKQLY
jgi:hypothetical protein